MNQRDSDDNNKKMKNSTKAKKGSNDKLNVRLWKNVLRKNINQMASLSL